MKLSDLRDEIAIEFDAIELRPVVPAK